MEAESLETIDRGRGINTTSSEKPTLVFLGALLGSALAIESASTSVDWIAESREPGKGAF